MQKKGDIMRKNRSKIIQIFYCYAPEDLTLLEKLEEHLSPLKRLNEITSWSDREIRAGVEFEKEIEWFLIFSDIILLLVSPSFMSSDICYSTQMQLAIERQKKKKATVIPVVLRPTLWEQTPIGKLQSLPTNKKPITLWRNRDAAFLDVVTEIWAIIEDLKNKKQKKSKIFTKPIAVIIGLIAIILTLSSYSLLNLDVNVIVAHRTLFSIAILLIFLAFILIVIYTTAYNIHKIIYRKAEDHIKLEKKQIYIKAEEHFLNTIIEFRKQGEIDEILGIIDLFDRWKQLLSEKTDLDTLKSQPYNWFDRLRDWGFDRLRD